MDNPQPLSPEELAALSTQIHVSCMPAPSPLRDIFPVRDRVTLSRVGPAGDVLETVIVDS